MSGETPARFDWAGPVVPPYPLKAAAGREMRFNDLRHTFGTRMAAAGVPMRTLQEWMGHHDSRRR